MKVLVVSQPNTVVHNQLVYVRLAERGWDVHLVVPNRWVDEYSPDGYTPPCIGGFTGTFSRLRVINPGSVQRHVYVTDPLAQLRRLRPDAVFLEQEPFSLPCLQWGLACERLGIPWGVQGDENLDRPFPWPARVIRRWAMPRVRFFAARSPNAGAMLERWGATHPIGVVAHTLPEWSAVPRPPRSGFTVGYAGRLVEAKGLRDLVAAWHALGDGSRLLVVGDGPLRGELEAAGAEVRTGVRTDAMPAAYAEMDVLVLPSRTTETWAEQFGKVLSEALLCGTPVVGSSSGEIPWVVETTGGGVVFPEGDVAALAARLRELRDDPARREALAAAGRAGVWEHFAPRVAAAALDDLLHGAVWAQRRHARAPGWSRLKRPDRPKLDHPVWDVPELPQEAAA